MHGKFERNAARIADAVAYAACQLQMMPVARNEIAARLRNADNGLAALKLLAGQAVIQIALEIKRRHARIVGIVPPGAAPKPLASILRHWSSLRSSRPLPLKAIFAYKSAPRPGVMSTFG